MPAAFPPRPLLESSELFFKRAKDEFAVHGIKIGDLTLDLTAMQKAPRFRWSRP